MSRPDPNARAMAKLKASQVPLNVADPTMDPEMQKTLAEEQQRVASRKATFAPFATGLTAPSGWSKILSMFNGKAHPASPQPSTPVPALSETAKKYYGK